MYMQERNILVYHATAGRPVETANLFGSRPMLQA